MLFSFVYLLPILRLWWMQILVMDYGFGEPRFIFQSKIKLSYYCMTMFFPLNGSYINLCIHKWHLNHCTVRQFGIAFLEANAVLFLSQYEVVEQLHHTQLLRMITTKGNVTPGSMFFFLCPTLDKFITRPSV